MATPDEHLVQAGHNEDVAAALALAGYYDWAVTALFYSALHLVQSVLARNEDIPPSHAARERLMRRTVGLTEVADSYRALRAFSEYARYELRRYTAEEFERIRTRHYLAVEQRILSLTPDASSESGTDEGTMDEEENNG